MPTTKDTLERFAALFDGYTKAHGEYGTQYKVDPETGKHKSWAKTTYEPLERKQWSEHLQGDGPGLGIIMLRDDDTCLFGAIDYDVRTVDHVKLEKQIEALKLPLVVCRSKSGGAHLYIFIETPVVAEILRQRLEEWKAALGIATYVDEKGLVRETETFPKQSTRAGDADPGNWINIPYQNARASVRFAIRNGIRLSLEEFLDYAESRQVSAEYLDSPYFSPIVKDDDLFYEGPPCLITIQQQGGFANGTKSDGLMAVGVYLKKRFPEEWQSKFDDYAGSMCQEHVPQEDLNALKHSIASKNYSYRCKLSPINSHCQKRLCLQRHYGVGDSTTTNGNQFLGVTCYEYKAPDPPMWAFEISGKRVMVDNDTFYNRDALNRAIMAHKLSPPLMMPQGRWLKMLGELVKGADSILMPDDAGPSGQIWERICTFLEHGVNAMAKEEVLTGKILKINGFAYFRSADLFDYFKQHGTRFKSEQVIWQMLREHGAESNTVKLGSRGIKIWQIPWEFDLAKDDFGVRELPSGREF
jgi:hypothetical protein